LRRFVERALAKLPRLNEEQLRSLLLALADENESMDAALDSMLDGIVVCDREHLPIIYNKSAERMLHFTGAEVPDRPLWLSVSDEDLAEFFKATLEGEETVLDREFGLESKGGARLVAVSVSTLVSQGKIEGAIVHMEDITEKRHREAQLRRAESLASLTTLAAGVAHEIKNPLGSISIHIQLIKKSLQGKEEVEVPFLERHLGVVDEEIERLNKIVVDFLFAVRPMDVQLREADPGRLVAEIADFIRPEAERASVGIELALAEGLPFVALDERLMKQALLNLVKNALAAMPGGGELKLSASRADEEVRLAVEDSGVGISEEDLPKIFEPYFTTKDNGTGLGLTITFKIVREHGGEITVASRPGQGSTFTIHLPVPQKEKRLLRFDADEAIRVAAPPQAAARADAAGAADSACEERKQ
jgi:two-component system, sporulation sensor kinase E